MGVDCSQVFRPVNSLFLPVDCSMWLDKKKKRKNKQLFNHGCIKFAGYNLSQWETVNCVLNLAGLGRNKNSKKKK